MNGPNGRSWNLGLRIVGKIVQSQTKWTGHMVRIKDKRLPEKSKAKEQ